MSGAAVTRAVTALVVLAAAAVTAPRVQSAAEALRAGGLTALPGQAPGPNVVQNAGFETRAQGETLPGWKVRVDGDVWAVAPEGRTGAALRLSGANRERLVPSAEQPVTLEPGHYTIEGWVKTQNLGAADGRSGVRLCLDARPKADWWQCTDVAKGTGDWRLLKLSGIPVAERGTYRMWLGAYGGPEGVAWFDDVSLTEQRKPPLDVYLLYPNFRGLLFDDRPQTVRVAVAAPNAPANARVRLSLVAETGDAVVARREYPAAKPFTAELDAGAAPAGTFLLRSELLGGNGEASFRYPDYRIVKAPASARKGLTVWVDEHNVTHLGGKPAFVLGLYNTSGYTTTRSTYATGMNGWGNDRIGQAPINMLINYHMGQAPIPALQTYMDDLLPRGIYYLQTVNFYYQDFEQYKTIEYPSAKQGEDALNRWVARTLGAHPGLGGFYTADERPADMVPKVFKQHHQLAGAAPGTVTYAVLGDGWENQAPLWRDALDVMGLDPYPIVKPAGQNHLAMVGEWTRIGQDAVKGARPLWMVIQYFPLTSAGGWPTESELRQMSWMAIVEGARGLFYWSFGAKGLAWVKDPREKEARWAELVRVTREIKALENVLLAPDAALVSRESSGGAVRTLGKQLPDGARYLFAYNTKNSPVKVTWTLAAPAAGTLDLSSGKPGPGVDGGALSVEFAPYEVKRYRIR